MATIPDLDGWSVGERVAAAKLTEHTKTSIDFLVSGRPVAKMSSSVNQSIPNTTLTKLTFDTQDKSTDGMVDLANDKLTVVTAGYYKLYAVSSFASNAAGVRTCLIYVNGVQAATTFMPSAAGVFAIRVDLEKQLAVSDYIEAYTYQSSGGALNTAATTAGYPVYLGCEWVCS